jgi:N-acetylated-alpha-linked acidic dipeptidase
MLKIPSIPVQPISWLDALPLLQGLQGTEAPAQWQGALNITYHIGM